MSKNAFFQLIMKNDGTYLQLVPSKDNGRPIDYAELDEYLSKRHIEYDKIAVSETLSNLTDIKIVKLDSKSRPQEGEGVKVSISEDKMTAVCRFYPPSAGGSPMSETEIINDLVKAGVKYGVIQETLKSFVEKREYFTDITMAKALPCIQGKDAVITYYFNTDLTRKPKLNDDGTVDFHQLDTISHVQAGELLASLEPAVQGRTGINVCGGAIQPGKVRVLLLKNGNNIHLSEDGCKMYSDVAGHATLVDDKVFVSNTFEVAADVDASTGDIAYEGNVTIKGSVRTGYKVVADGDIVVDGVVEGAQLSAKGQIILKRGIQGMNKAKVHAGGNIVAKFIESASVTTNGYLTAEAILHSTVDAKGDIIVGGKKGFITGGEIRSGTMISAKTAGSTMGTNTLLEVGVDPALMEEYRKLEKELPGIIQEQERVNQNLILYLKKIKSGEKLSADKMILVKTLSINKEQLEERKNQINARLDELHEFMEEQEAGCIKISDTIYPGCKVTIANVIYFIRKETIHCTLVRDGADVRVAPY